MNTPITIITGASRGLGAAVARQLAERGHRLLTLSRGAPPALQGHGHAHWAVDLVDGQTVAQALQRWLHEQRDPRSEAVTLINNAGVVSELSPLADVGLDDLSRALRVGLEAPTLLTAAFLHATRDWLAPRKVLLVSSGLGRRALAGCASYCTAKAGLDHLARAVALEEAARPTGARIVSLAPGVIDTDMQVQMRSADPQRFAERQRFVGLKSSGQLDSPDAAAAKLLAFLERADFGTEPVADLRGH